MAKTAKNPLEILKLSPWLLNEMLPWQILECAKTNRDTAARRWHPDVTTDEKDIRRFREAQAAYDAIEAASEPERAEWLKRYLRPNPLEVQKRELNRQLLEAVAELNRWWLSIGECLLLQAIQIVPPVSAWYPGQMPACRILCAGLNTRIRSTRCRVDFELEIEPDGSVTYWEVKRKTFRVSDGMPNVGSGWMSIHSQGPNYPSYYYAREDGTSRPFPFRLIGSLSRNMTADYFEQHFPTGKLDFPPAEDPFYQWGWGMDWCWQKEIDRPVQWPLPEMSSFAPWIWARDNNRSDILLSRVNEAGDVRFWVVGPIKAVHMGPIKAVQTLGLPQPDD